MKKVSKKQKLIIAIAIILTVVILAIVFTTNIISNNSNLANGGYLATTANANSNLVASYIKDGITIGGITGTLKILDTSDADATPEDISAGKTAYVKGAKITGTRDESSLAQLKKSGQAVTENTTVEDRYNNQIKIPEGFKIADDSPVTIPEGVVIEDVSAPGKTTYTKGSQFVWIPVGNVSTDTNGSTTEIKLGRYTFGYKGKETLVQSAENWNDTSDNILIETYYKELATSSYGNATAKSLENFVTKALISGGYYIGRYEIGDALAIDSARTGANNVSNPNNPITCKAEIYPYTHISQNDASRLAREMYSSSNFDSDLINSYAWDTAIVFIQTFSGDIDYSKQTRLQSTLAKCGEATDEINKDVRCNIYDMAGNTYEWTTETCTTSNPCSYHGGYYNSNYSYASFRTFSVWAFNTYLISFRPTLYL